MHAAPGTFTLTSASRIVLHGGGGAAAAAVATGLAGILRPSTGFALPIVAGRAGAADVELRIDAAASLGREGYRLDAGAHGLRLSANRPEGLFRGVQTLRQLLPAAVERRDGPARPVDGRRRCASSTGRASPSAARCSTWPATS